MGSSPIPPHERTWRHPSELASAEWQAIRDAEPPRSTRGFAIATGTLGLVAVGVLIFTVTPGAQGSPVAVSATSPSVSHTSPLRATPVGARTAPAALATPIGDGHLALMTMTGVAAGLGTEIDVQLTNGPVVTAVVDATTPGVMIVSIHSETDGHQIADTPPAPDDIVTVLAEPPVTIAYEAVSTIDAKEGTPVVDRYGDLIGLCTQHTSDDDDDDDDGPPGEDAQPIRLIDVTGDSAIDAQRAVATTIAP